MPFFIYRNIYRNKFKDKFISNTFFILTSLIFNFQRIVFQRFVLLRFDSVL